MTRTRLALAALAITGALVLPACSASTSDPEAEAPVDAEAPADSEAAVGPDVDVPWDNYGDGVKDRIDALGEAADCEALQAEFDTADANNERQRESTGTGNAELMTYIDGWMSEAGCYE